MYIPWGGTRTLAYHCPIVSWLPFLFLCIPSFFWLATIWICPLELRECQGGCCCCVASVVSDSVRPHRRRPTRLPHPWDSPGKNTGEGCHFLLQCVKVKSESEVTQSYLTLSDPMDCSLPGSSIHGIFQARVLEWGAIAFSTRRLNEAFFYKQERISIPEGPTGSFLISKYLLLSLAEVSIQGEYFNHFFKLLCSLGSLPCIYVIKVLCGFLLLICLMSI